MTERYTATEGLEHAERAHEAAAESNHPALRSVPLIAAILAVFAGLSSLYSSRLGERMLSFENQAVLYEARAADAWAEYQADSLKAHLADTVALIATGSAARSKLKSESRAYRARQGPLRAAATDNEHERDQAAEIAERAERRKLVFDTAVAFFEIAIVLASVAALVRRPWVVIVAAALGITAIGFALRGLAV